jgi:glycosyltransferase involved in cell wall biosynthesis
MAARLPVIASAVGGIPDVVQDGVTGFLVQSGDEAGLAEKLRWILERPEAAAEMGVRAHTFAKRLFSTRAYVESYRQVFEAAKALIADGKSEHARTPV